MFAVRQCLLAKAVPIRGLVREDCHLQLSLSVCGKLVMINFILYCRLATRDPISGVTRDSPVQSSRCKNSLAGDEPVVVCSVLL